MLIVKDPPPEAIDEGTKADPADFAKQATDLQTLRGAVVDAANVGGSLWLSYLFVFFYLAIAAGGVTHRDLLFENPVKLPFLNIELPLIGFFVLGPPLFVIVHAYTLLHSRYSPARSGTLMPRSANRLATLTPKRACAASCRSTFSCNSSLARARLVLAGSVGCCD
jgi:hypothetical protein